MNKIRDSIVHDQAHRIDRPLDISSQVVGNHRSMVAANLQTATVPLRDGLSGPETARPGSLVQSFFAAAGHSTFA
jgi:hypothetical protein